MTLHNKGREADYLHWDPGTKPWEVHAWWTNAAVGYLIYWGDGEFTQAGPNNKVETHQYPSAGAYMIRARETSGAWMGQAQAVIPKNWDLPVTHGPSTENPALYEVVFGDADTSGFLPRFRVNWRDGAADEIQEAWGIPGGKFTRVLPNGKRTISVYDVMAHNYRHFRDIDINNRTDPEFSLTVDETDTTRRTAVLQLGTDVAKPVRVSWGDLTLSEDVADKVAKHTFPADVDDIYLVQVWYADESSTVTKPLTIPFP
jgi:hypothetical protein